MNYMLQHRANAAMAAIEAALTPMQKRAFFLKEIHDHLIGLEHMNAVPGHAGFFQTTARIHGR